MQAFYAMCRRHGLKITPQRIAIYKVIANMATHPSTDEVYQLVRKSHPTISFDTVNRTLLTFVEMGLLHTVESYSGARRFDPNLTEHHHIHCIKCGKTTDFSHRTFDNLEIPEEVVGDFKVLQKRVSLHGICSDCREAEL